MTVDRKKVALVTGASSGIGESTVGRLIQDGFIVYGAARRVSRMTQLERIGARILAMDVTDDASMVAGIDHIIAREGRIDVLINNAGYGSYGAIEDVNLTEARRQFEVNVFGLARMTQLVLPHMRQNESGKVINISSMGGKLVTPLGGWYHSTKFAVEALSDALRFETQPFGIDVIVIEPGSIASEWTQIAIDSMLEKSGDTAYSGFAHKTARFFQQASKKSSPPELIANLISKAISAKRPKTRYVAGKFAKPFLFMRRILSDRMFDNLLSMQMNSIKGAKSG